MRRSDTYDGVLGPVFFMIPLGLCVKSETTAIISYTVFLRTSSTEASSLFLAADLFQNLLRLHCSRNFSILSSQD